MDDFRREKNIKRRRKVYLALLNENDFDGKYEIKSEQRHCRLADWLTSSLTKKLEFFAKLLFILNA